MTDEKKVLIIDDELSLRAALSRGLEVKGYKVLQAKDGAEGAGMASLEKPDLIILDILMPKVHGMELLKQIRNSEWGKNTPIIIVTNIDSPAHKQESANLGVQDYLTKSSVSIDDVIKLIVKRLAEHEKSPSEDKPSTD